MDIQHRTFLLLAVMLYKFTATEILKIILICLVGDNLVRKKKVSFVLLGKFA